MAQLFDVEVNTINYHLKEIYTSNELAQEATISKMEIVRQEGNRQVARERIFYNLDAIISVGYRVNSQRATYCAGSGRIGADGEGRYVANNA